MRHAVDVIAVHLKMGALFELQYRASFWSHIVNLAASLGITFASLGVVFSQTTTLNGWTSTELLAVIGVFYMASSVVNMVIVPSLNQFNDDVRLGDFDFRLMKPVDAQLLVAIQRIDIWQSINFIVGAGLLTYSTIETSAASWWQIVVLPPLLIASIIILYCFWVIMSSIAFAAVNAFSAIHAPADMLDAAKWPISIFPTWMKALLTFVFPAGFAVTVPAEAATGRLGLEMVAAACLFAGVMWFVSRAIWQRSIKGYSGASA